MSGITNLKIDKFSEKEENKDIKNGEFIMGSLFNWFNHKIHTFLQYSKEKKMQNIPLQYSVQTNIINPERIGGVF